ncbi:MAG: cysteine protease [Brevundimonas sp.]|uniref:cysteine protease n=1 Tax=Brevundimonas sp. TaxID=1871086 RepID=UPI002486DD73|nr:cysteine protease [Brevundimonas sp.]MDI1325747.1 cysteine protease [Brevundimonas sp.]
MPIPKLATLIGGLLLSKGGRRMAGRHAGKLALATLAFQLWEQRQAAKHPGRPQSSTAQPRTAHPRQRWSGRRV